MSIQGQSRNILKLLHQRMKFPQFLIFMLRSTHQSSKIKEILHFSGLNGRKGDFWRFFYSWSSVTVFLSTID
jgi:hypothetical protein